MEIDFLGLCSKFSPITVKEETNDCSKDSAPTRGMMDWSFSSKVGSAPQFLSFGSSQQDRRRNSVNDHLLPSSAFTPTSIVDDQNQRTHYSSEGRMFLICSHQDQASITASMSEPVLLSQYRPERKSFTNSFINPQPLGRSPIMTSPFSVFPAPNTIVGTTDIRSSSTPIAPPAQLTIFYAGSVSVYEDISPEKAEAIMLLARNGPQAKPAPMSKAQKPVHHSSATIDPPTMPPSFLPSTSYIVSETGSGFNGVTRLGATKTMSSVASKPRNNQNDASNMAPSVGLPQARKASLTRFLEKRKERVINVSPYYVDNKSSIDRRTPMSECVNSSLRSSSAVRPN